MEKFSAFCATRRILIAYTSARHLSISTARSVQSMSHPSTSLRLITMVVYYLRLGLPSGLLPWGFPAKTLYAPLLFFVCATCRVHLILIDLITQILFGGDRLLCCSLSCIFYHMLSRPLRPKCLPQHPIFEHPQPMFLRQLEHEYNCD
jgi:hypothetical protein